MDQVDAIPAWVLLAVALVPLGLLVWGTAVIVRRKLHQQPAGKLGWAVVIFWLAVVVSMFAEYKKTHKTPAEIAAEAREANRPRLSSSAVETIVTKVLRDPDSAKFGEISVYNDRKLDGHQVTFACGSVNAKNGFGGYTGSSHFVFVKDTLTVAIEGDTRNNLFMKLWNTLCAGNHSS